MDPTMFNQFMQSWRGYQPPQAFQPALAPAPTPDPTLMGMMMMAAANSQPRTLPQRRPRLPSDEDDEEDEPRRAPRRRVDPHVVAEQKLRELELKFETKTNELCDVQEELSEAKSSLKTVTQERKESRTKCTKLERSLAAAETRIKELEAQLRVRDMCSTVPITPLHRGSPTPLFDIVPDPLPAVPNAPKTLAIYETAGGASVVARMLYTAGMKVRDVLAVSQADIFMAVPGDDEWIPIKAEPRADFDLEWKLVQRGGALKSATSASVCVCCASPSCRGSDARGRPCGGCFLKFAKASTTGTADAAPSCTFAPTFDWRDMVPQVFRDSHRGSEERLVKYSQQMSIVAAVRYGIGEDTYSVKIAKGAQRRVTWLVRVAAVDGTDLAWAPSTAVPEALQWAVLTRHLRDAWGKDVEVTVASAASAASLRQEAVWRGELTRALKDYVEYFDGNMTGPHRLWVVAAAAPGIPASASAIPMPASVPLAVAAPVASRAALPPSGPVISRPADVIPMPHVQ